jgi:3-oxoacyl-(acyl-carrier-protein) synthase
MPKALVTGMGIVSALGADCGENLDRLRRGESGIRLARYLDSRYSTTHLFGEVPLSDSDLLGLVGPDSVGGFPRTDLLALKAFQEAVADAGLTAAHLYASDTAFISASTVGGMSLTQELYADSSGQTTASPYLGTYACGAHALRIAGRYRMNGFTTTFNTACSSSANAIMLGARMIRAGKIKRAIVGGTDALARFTINGFDSLQILSAEACKPFDETRIGLTLGEGAAYLVLESEELCASRKCYAEVLGYGNANDAFHPSALSEEATGVRKAIAGALRTGRVDGKQIDYINAHGTATPNNDITELRGIQETLGWIPPYSSTKGFTGHTLGAAGAIEAIFSIFSLRYDELYPNLNCLQPIAAFKREPERSYRKQVPLSQVLSNSFGFAGNCTTLLLAKAS